MAVALRCPECKHKLRLAEAPDPDSEIECPECEHVFPCPPGVARAAGGDGDGEKPRKKKPAENGEEPEKKKKKGKKKPAPEVQPNKNKKRKAKKRKTNKAVLIAIILGGMLIFGTVGGVVVWVFTKKSASQEMMTYLPDECDEVFGFNIGHTQKYPMFYENCEKTFESAGFKKAGDAFAKAVGLEFNTAFDYVVQGTGRAGGKPDGPLLEATVFRTKVEFDPGAVAKIPGAREGSAAGVKYFALPDIPELGYPGLRVFAPTNRVVVFCRGDMPDAKFKAMLVGNRDNPEGTPLPRAGVLGKQAIRGTVWKFYIYGRAVPRPAPPSTPAAPGAELSDEDGMKKEIADLAAKAKGSAYKASVGSKEVRGEWIIWYNEPSDAADVVKKCKDKEWIKDDEKMAPRWWRAVANKSGADRKTAETVLRDGLSFRSSGPLFTIRTYVDTKTLQVGQLVGAFYQPSP